MKPVRLLLVGMMGVGKSTVGRELSARTGWPYLDNDELVRRASGVPTPDVLRARGEAALRAAESGALTVALALQPPVVAGVAGGVVGDPADRKRLVSAPDTVVVWLRARMATLVARVGAGEGRPWLQPDPLTALQELYAGRAELYAEVAAYTVDVDDLTPAQVADRILAALPS